MAVHLLDLDQFKPVNDRFGHAAGDELLVDVARRLNRVAMEGLCIARLGGDEFAVLQPLPPAECASAAVALARSIIDEVGKPYDLKCGQASIGLSVGIELATSSGCAPETVLHHADVALYAAKRAGRGTAIVYCGPGSESG
jgi:diguanylate cyclase (GGDEF)-like protein